VLGICDFRHKIQGRAIYLLLPQSGAGMAHRKSRIAGKDQVFQGKINLNDYKSGSGNFSSVSIAPNTEKIENTNIRHTPFVAISPIKIPLLWPRIADTVVENTPMAAPQMAAPTNRLAKVAPPHPKVTIAPQSMGTHIQSHQIVLKSGRFPTLPR